MDELERLRADDQAHMDAELAENNELLDKVREEVCLASSSITNARHSTFEAPTLTLEADVWVNYGEITRLTPMSDECALLTPARAMALGWQS